jgi:light-regulated signal transduction histidine kinase (bacteriophytochrome)
MQSDSPSNAFETEVADRFGLLPNFFRSAKAAPELIQQLWGFAKAGYLDNPMPSVFKERLFVGFSEQFAAKLFEPFTQEEQGRDRRGGGGLGLGLTIASRLAELQGGTLTAASAGLNQGATFTRVGGVSTCTVL